MQSYGYEYDAECGRKPSFIESLIEFLGILAVWFVMKISKDC